MGSNPCRSGGRILFSGVNFLCWLLFRYPFHPCVTTAACKSSRSFCQKCRWQVTAKHTYTLCIIWLCMKWHGACFMVYTKRAEMAAVSCGTSHGYYFFINFKCAINLLKASHSCRITCKCNETAREWRLALYKSDQQLDVKTQFLSSCPCFRDAQETPPHRQQASPGLSDPKRKVLTMLNRSSPVQNVAPPSRNQTNWRII